MTRSGSTLLILKHTVASVRVGGGCVPGVSGSVTLLARPAGPLCQRHSGKALMVKAPVPLVSADTLTRCLDAAGGHQGREGTLDPHCVRCRPDSADEPCAGGAGSTVLLGLSFPICYLERKQQSMSVGWINWVLEMAPALQEALHVHFLQLWSGWM